MLPKLQVLWFITNFAFLIIKTRKSLVLTKCFVTWKEFTICHWFWKSEWVKLEMNTDKVLTTMVDGESSRTRWFGRIRRHSKRLILVLTTTVMHIMQMFAYFFSVVLPPASMWKLMQKALLLMKWLYLRTPLISVIKLLAFSFLL